VSSAVLFLIRSAGSGLARRVSEWLERYPYKFSFFVSLAIMGGIIFTTLPVEVIVVDVVPTENIEFVDIDQIRSVAVRRNVRRTLSVRPEAGKQLYSDVERAAGTSDDPDAVDLSFYPNVVPPKPIGKLERRYPKIAQENGVEANLSVELLIAANGVVLSVRVLGIRLSKELPPELHAEMARAFSREAISILRGVRFTPAVVNGRHVPVRFEIPIRFRLEG
jgi:hypothetical protein